MVAQYRHGMARLDPAAGQLQHCNTVGPAVDEVAQKDDATSVRMKLSAS